MQGSKKRLLVCGSRSWTKVDDIRNCLNYLVEMFPDTTIIHGGARGADTIAGTVAAEMGLPVEVYPADWMAYGRGAGPIRNQKMLDDGHPDKVLAFVRPSLDKSRGTRDMVQRARLAGIPTLVLEDPT